jgi:hypothetical protein
MFGIAYILICAAFGYVVVRELLPQLLRPETEVFRLLVRRTDDAPSPLRRWMIVLPASYIVGTLLVAWTTYLVAYALRGTATPLLFANAVTMPFFAGIALAWRMRRCRTFAPAEIARGLRNSSIGIGVVVASALAIGFLDAITFFRRGGDIALGVSAFSDLVTHVSMIRSFSLGCNFPTEYVYFADGTVRYHFMFQFLAGNLEFLGLPLHLAFNIPSVLSFVSMVMLLFGLTIAFCGSRLAAAIACVLAFFRSSFAFFTFARGAASFTDLLHRIVAVNRHIGATPHEDWGLWNQNVFVNQRHLPFSIALLLFALILMLPLFAEMMDRLRDKGFGPRMRELLASRGAWAPESLTRAVTLGALLGLSAFWNGAVFIAAMLVLFVLALVSAHRLEYLIVAVVGLALAQAQAAFFIGGSGGVSPTLYLGFLTPVKTLWGLVLYYVELFGILPLMVLASLALPLRGILYFVLAAGAPFLFANSVSLTPDIVVNHKYIMIAVILANIPVAFLLAEMFRRRVTGILAGILLFLLTCTGGVDLITLVNINAPRSAVVIAERHPVKLWVEKNIPPNDIVLTKNFFTHPILAAGRKLFNGWQYYSWSAGYDTAGRDRIAKEIFEGTDADRVEALLREKRIRYVLADAETKREFAVNEPLLDGIMERVYAHGPSGTIVYRVRR